VGHPQGQLRFGQCTTQVVTSRRTAFCGPFVPIAAFTGGSCAMRARLVAAVSDILDSGSALRKNMVAQLPSRAANTPWRFTKRRLNIRAR
jgi:hypothetical protein